MNDASPLVLLANAVLDAWQRAARWICCTPRSPPRTDRPPPTPAFYAPLRYLRLLSEVRFAAGSRTNPSRWTCNAASAGSSMNTSSDVSPSPRRAASAVAPPPPAEPCSYAPRNCARTDRDQIPARETLPVELTYETGPKGVHQAGRSRPGAAMVRNEEARSANRCAGSCSFHRSTVSAAACSAAEVQAFPRSVRTSRRARPSRESTSRLR